MITLLQTGITLIAAITLLAIPLVGIRFLAVKELTPPRAPADLARRLEPCL